MTYSTYYDADYHITETQTAYECVEKGCDYGYKDSTTRVKEQHFYDYDYNLNVWKCDCGDSYTHQ